MHHVHICRKSSSPGSSYDRGLRASFPWFRILRSHWQLAQHRQFRLGHNDKPYALTSPSPSHILYCETFSLPTPLPYVPSTRICSWGFGKPCIKTYTMSHDRHSYVYQDRTSPERM